MFDIMAGFPGDALTGALVFLSQPSAGEARSPQPRLNIGALRVF